MGSREIRAEIVSSGVVQGVGYRYFVLRHAQRLGVTGYVKNLWSGEVLTVAEGETYKIDELISELRKGPFNAHVTGLQVNRSESKNEFQNFEVRL
ncbi:MAG: acylphosphatase [Ignavibacteriaceae bacterium]|nr:acylphosphatase [Ignavibacteriaceae bacterium]NUM70187.1 acylphosphatase [Ignavibacteriaceae bacterium]